MTKLESLQDIKDTVPPLPPYFVMLAKTSNQPVNYSTPQ